MKTLTMTRIRIWMTLCLTALAVLGMSAARPAEAAVPMIKGQTFYVNSTPEHAYDVKLFFSWQDNAGNFIVEATHTGKPKVIGTGKISTVPGGYTIAFKYNLTAATRYSYSGSIRQWGGPAPANSAKWFMAGSFTIQTQTTWGPILSGPRPFCANANYIEPPH